MSLLSETAAIGVLGEAIRPGQYKEECLFCHSAYRHHLPACISMPALPLDVYTLSPSLSFYSLSLNPFPSPLFQIN